MAGIYIHIPFCKQKCHYCNFYSTVSLAYRQDYISALTREIKSRQKYLDHEVVNTIYFGGGTPSMFSSDEISYIINLIDFRFNVPSDAEITLEANPDDLDKNKLNDIKNYTSVNRLSIGVQSFFDDDLQYLNRVHSSKQAQNSIENALKLGFDNITIDLIYGIPNLSNSKWKENLKIFFDYKIPHLSSYSLTVEPKTALDLLIKKKKLENIVESESIDHFKILIEETEKQNFINYEISNFALEGHYSKHNSIYWLGGHYLGLGPSAHSYNGKSRQWNVMNIKKYCEEKQIKNIIDEKEYLSKDQMYNEYVLTSLRTSWGCDIEHIKNAFGEKHSQHFITNITKTIKENNATRNGNIFTLTNSGKLFADGIASSLFFGL
jgi:oxygen-independent coproporphyrinogen-3 oxidase